MAKKSKKQRNSKAPKRPNISPLTMLRPRLDGLMNNPEWLDRSDNEIMVDVQTVVRELDAYDYLPTLIRAVNAASPDVNTRLNQLIPNWLVEAELVPILLTLVDEEAISLEDQGIAKEWLAQAGVDEEQLNKERESTFFDAYFGIDEFPSQAFLIIMWYANRSRTRVSGVNFLIDYNPPWDGSTKDGFYLPQGSPRDLIRDAVDIWREKPLTITQLDGAEAKAKLAEVVQANLEHGVRLHKDLAVGRDKLIKHVLPLPDLPDSPTISLSDLDTICSQGEKSEVLKFREQNFGRRVRMDDGKEVVILGDLDDEDWE